MEFATCPKCGGDVEYTAAEHHCLKCNGILEHNLGEGYLVCTVCKDVVKLCEGEWWK